MQRNKQVNLKILHFFGPPFRVKLHFCLTILEMVGDCHGDSAYTPLDGMWPSYCGCATIMMMVWHHYVYIGYIVSYFGQQSAPSYEEISWATTFLCCRVKRWDFQPSWKGPRWSLINITFVSFENLSSVDQGF